MTVSTLITDYIGQGTAASRPASPNTSSGALPFYYETDTQQLYMWDTNASAWKQVSLGAAGLPASPAQGDLVYYNGTSWVNLAPGTSGDVLTTYGSGANPAWSAGGGSSGTGLWAPLISAVPTLSNTGLTVGGSGTARISSASARKYQTV